MDELDPTCSIVMMPMDESLDSDWIPAVVHNDPDEIRKALTEHTLSRPLQEQRPVLRSGYNGDRMPRLEPGHHAILEGKSVTAPARLSRPQAAPGRIVSAVQLCVDQPRTACVGLRKETGIPSPSPTGNRTKPRRRSSATMADMEEVEVEVVVAHNERATLRVGDVFLKIDADQTRTDVEVEAMALAPIPTPKVLWRKPPVLALAALSGIALGCLGEPSTASSAAWAAAGAAVRVLHDAPLPPRLGQSRDEIASRLDDQCEWLVTNGVLPADVVTRNRRIAEAALRPGTPVFVHGDLQVDHVFVAGDEVTGVVDWSEAS
jgi:hypothetical protein